jgi:hypothetical protein
MKTPVTRITVSLPQDAYEALAMEAEKTGRRLSDLVRDAVTSSLFREPWRGIGDVVMEVIRAGGTNADALAEAKRRFPGAKTSLASVAWYRSHMRSKGEDIHTDAEARRKQSNKE